MKPKPHNKVITLVRGLPGSGKTRKAWSLYDQFMAEDHIAFHVEADHFFISLIDGEYHYDASKIKEAHQWCASEVETRMKYGAHGRVDRIIVANTFVRWWEMRTYADLARKYGWLLEIVESDTEWKDDPQLCWEHCVHDVPLRVIQRMHSQWDKEYPAEWFVSCLKTPPYHEIS